MPAVASHIFVQDYEALPPPLPLNTQVGLNYVFSVAAALHSSASSLQSSLDSVAFAV